MPGAVAIDGLGRRRRRDRLGRHRSALRELTRQSIDSSAQGQRELFSLILQCASGRRPLPLR
jgi:hypothetical protein